jgi:hypothetical protein
MKCTCLILLAFLISLPGRLLAQNNAYEEERYKILNENIRNILETQGLLLKRQSELKERYESLAREVDKLKEESSRGTSQFASKEYVKALGEKILEVDKKRIDDNKLILESIDSIKNLAKTSALPAKEPKNHGSTADAPDPYIYEVKPGDSLEGIIIAYNKLFKEQGKGKITKDHVLSLNPDLKAPSYTVRVGKKLRIPEPVKK